MDPDLTPSERPRFNSPKRLSSTSFSSLDTDLRPQHHPQLPNPPVFTARRLHLRRLFASVKNKTGKEDIDQRLSPQPETRLISHGQHDAEVKEVSCPRRLFDPSENERVRFSTPRLDRCQSRLNRELLQSPSRRQMTKQEDVYRSISRESDVICGPGFLPKAEILLQPETRPISEEQLRAEVKGIYAGLIMVEAKCVEVDTQQATSARAHPSTQLKLSKLSSEQWQALTILRRTLLHEHHDFFLTSQHPSASTAPRRLASKYSMPARMWRHGIHAFLEILRHRLPDSIHHMLAFIYIGYSIMAPLYETVPGFNEEWITCLGDLSRYRMAIEDEDIKDRELWASVAKFWHVKASDKCPRTGRLFHHLSILARPYILQQLDYYVKSLLCSPPFKPAQESIMTLLRPIQDVDEKTYQKPYGLESGMVKACDLPFIKIYDKFNSLPAKLIGLSDNRSSRGTAECLAQSYYIAIAKVFSIFDYGYKPDFCTKARSLFRAAWNEVKGTTDSPLIPLKNIPRPLPMDYRSWADTYFPNDWFEHHAIIEDEKGMEKLSEIVQRAERLWLGFLSARCALTAFRSYKYVDAYFPNDWFEYFAINEDGKGMEKPSEIVQRAERIRWLGILLPKRYVTEFGSYPWSDREILRIHISKIAVGTRSVYNEEQHEIQSTVINSVGVPKLIANGVLLMQSMPRSSEINSQVKQSAFWTDVSSSSQHRLVGMPHLVDIIQAHEYHTHNDFQSNPPSQEAAFCIERKLAFMRIDELLSLLEYKFKRFLQRKCAGLFRMQGRTFIVAIATMFRTLPNVMARPLNPSPSFVLSPNENDSGFSQYWKDVWHVFKERYSGPLLMNILWAVFLVGLFLLITFHDKGRWKETDLLAIATSCTSAPSFFLGMGDWLSDWQLAFLWIFNARLNLRLLERNLLSLPRSRSPTSICIITTGCVSAGVLAQRIPIEDGRYANHWILATMLAPFMTCFTTHIWSVFIKESGIARGLEDGTYTGVTARLWRQVNRLLRQIIFTVVALVVICLLY